MLEIAKTGTMFGRAFFENCLGGVKIGMRVCNVGGERDGAVRYSIVKNYQIWFHGCLFQGKDKLNCLLGTHPSLFSEISNAGSPARICIALGKKGRDRFPVRSAGAPQGG